MAMLAIAYTRGDESIKERPSPSEVGGYVFDARDVFHKVFAAAGGYYLEIDTAADGHYNATGLQRVHRASVPFPALSDTVAPERGYSPKEPPKAAVALGVEWQTDANGPWIGLADFLGKGKRKVSNVQLKTDEASSQKVGFTLTYALEDGSGPGRTVSEAYKLTSDGVVQTSSVSGQVTDLRVQWPVLVQDGVQDTQWSVANDGITVTQRGSSTMVSFAPGQIKEKPVVADIRLVNHNGYVRTATVAAAGRDITTTIRLYAR
ncbi:MAG: hypothetical protein QM754_17330 [Tepidisphaeraceae bacterium]